MKKRDVQRLIQRIKNAILAALDFVWRFIYIVVTTMLVAGVVGNFAYDFLTKCTSRSCDIQVTDPRDWPLVLAHPLRTLIASGTFLIILVCSYWAHRYWNPPSNALGRGPYRSVDELRSRESERLNMGSPKAGSFPYIRLPVDNEYIEALKALRNMSEGATHGLLRFGMFHLLKALCNKREGATQDGILILGESNTGKTRFALEILQTLFMRYFYDWQIVVLIPGYTVKQLPDVTSLAGQNIIVFIDDFHTFVPDETTQAYGIRVSSSGIETVQALITRVRTHAKNMLIIATSQISIDGSLDLLSLSLQKVTMPTFASPNNRTAQIMETFEKAGAQTMEQWDGKLGSLVLGLSKEKEIYTGLQADPHQPNHLLNVLHAMKLLTVAHIIEHKETLVRHVCAEVFQDQLLLSDDICWERSVEALERRGFLQSTTETEGSRDIQRLVILKDIYFHEVITAYAGPLPVADFEGLGRILQRLDDGPNLLMLGIKYNEIGEYQRAVSLLHTVTALEPSVIHGWLHLGFSYYNMGALKQHAGKSQNEEFHHALDAFNRARRLDARSAMAWFNIATLRLLLKDYPGAIEASEQAIKYDPRNAVAYTNKGVALLQLGRYEDALDLFDQALNINSTLSLSTSA